MEFILPCLSIYTADVIQYIIYTLLNNNYVGLCLASTNLLAKLEIIEIQILAMLY